MVPLVFRSDQRHPVVITRHDAVTPWLDTAKLACGAPSPSISFQNLYMHCNISEPVYVGSQMAKVILTHGVNTDKQTVEDVFIFT